MSAHREILLSVDTRVRMWASDRGHDRAAAGTLAGMAMALVASRVADSGPQRPRGRRRSAQRQTPSVEPRLGDLGCERAGVDDVLSHGSKFAVEVL
jgi:hypothetical protein